MVSRFVPTIFVTCTLVFMACLESAEPTSYVADVRVYVDRSGESKWMNKFRFRSREQLVKYIELLVIEVNAQYYSSLLQYGLDLKVRLDKVVFTDKELVQTSDYKAYVTGVKQALQDYIYDNKQYSSDFDMAILATGLDLFYPGYGYGIIGEANIQSVCKDHRVGVIEIGSNKATDPLILAHEMGHVLGGFHDDQYCRPHTYTIGNVMNSFSNISSPNRFEFSACSARNMSEFINTLKPNCLLDSKLETPDISGMSADDACRQLNGRFWTMSRGAYFKKGYGDNFCKTLKCIERSNKVYRSKKHTNTDGLNCGNKKQCRSGSCVSTNEGDASMSDVCPYGDQDLTLFDLTACRSSSCGGWQKEWCCKTCPQ